MKTPPLRRSRIKMRPKALHEGERSERQKWPLCRNSLGVYLGCVCSASARQDYRCSNEGKARDEYRVSPVNVGRLRSTRASRIWKRCDGLPVHIGKNRSHARSLMQASNLVQRVLPDFDSRRNRLAVMSHSPGKQRLGREIVDSFELAFELVAALVGEFSIAQACIKIEIRMHNHKHGTRH